MKHTLPSAVFAATLLLTTVPAYAFTDVSPDHLNAEAISYVQSKGIVSGYADGTFKADASINRAELTKIIVGALFTPEGKNCFPDVHEEWFAPYVCSAKVHGIIGGYPDGSFRPAQNISFAEAAKIIVVAFGRETSGDSNVWYEGYVRSLGNVSAIPDSINRFDELITRGEMAEMIYRLHAKVTTKASTNYERMAGLPEVSSSSSASSAREVQEYPYAFTIGEDWKTDWNFFVDTKAPPVKEEEGINLLASLDLSRVDRVEEQGGKFPAFLRVRFPEGSASPFVSHFYGKPDGGVVARALGAMKPVESLHLTYYVRFPKDFDFSAEGSLPALGGGITTSNYGAAGTDFAVGLFWNKKGEVGVSGNFDIGDKSTSRMTDAVFQGDNEWHRVDITATMNTVPVKRLNGVLKVHFDNEVVFNFDNIRFRSSAVDKWDSLGLYGTIGTYDTFSIAPRDMYLDLAGFTLSEH